MGVGHFFLGPSPFVNTRGFENIGHKVCNNGYRQNRLPLILRRYLRGVHKGRLRLPSGNIR